MATVRGACVMKAHRIAQIKGGNINFNVPNKLAACQRFAFEAVYALYIAEEMIERYKARNIAQTAQINALRASLVAKTTEIDDYQAEILALDAMLENLNKPE